MNKIEIFEKTEFGQVRSYYADGMLWMCLSDVCKAIGIENGRDTTSRLKQKGVALTDTLTNGGKQKVTFIDEPNIYRLILRSDKPQAEPFIDWVTESVLPTIRRTGSYTAHKSKIPTLESIAGSRKTEYGDKLTNAIAKEVWAAVDKVYLKWLTKARAAEALQDFKRQVGRV